MRQVTVTIPDNFYPAFVEYLKDKPEVTFEEKYEYLDKTVPQWQQDLVLERIKNSKAEDYRNWEDVKKELEKNGISMDKYAVEMLFWAEQDLNEISIYYKNGSTII